MPDSPASTFAHGRRLSLSTFERPASVRLRNVMQDPTSHRGGLAAGDHVSLTGVVPVWDSGPARPCMVTDARAPRRCRSGTFRRIARRIGGLRMASPRRRGVPSQHEHETSRGARRRPPSQAATPRIGTTRPVEDARGRSGRSSLLRPQVPRPRVRRHFPRLSGGRAAVVSRRGSGETTLAVPPSLRRPVGECPPWSAMWPRMWAESTHATPTCGRCL